MLRKIQVAQNRLDDLLQIKERAMARSFFIMNVRQCLIKILRLSFILSLSK